MFKKFLSLVFVVVMSLSFGVNIGANDKPTITVNLSLGVGEYEEISSYIMDSTNLFWKYSNPGIVILEGTQLKGVKAGVTTLIGTSDFYDYKINIKVFKNTAYSTTPPPSKIIAKDTKQEISNTLSKKNVTQSYTDYSITVGLNDRYDISRYLHSNSYYYNYTWTDSIKGVATLKKNCITGLKEGMVRLNAIGNSTNKGQVIRFFVTVDNNYATKEINVRKNHTLDISNKFPEPISNYVFKTITNGPATLNDNFIISAGSSTGQTILQAHSLTGNKNYTLIISTL